jgi:hypothetical protein
MKFKYFYKNIEKISFLDYKIDHKHHLNLLNELNYINHFSNKFNLDIVISGSWASILHTNKIYRTIPDIDFCADINNIKLWLNILSDRYEFFYPQMYGSLNFLKSQIKNDFPVPFFNKRNKKIKIDIIFTDLNLIKNKIFRKKFKSFYLKYVVLHKKFDRMNLIYNRQKDIDDINFYSQFIKNENLLRNTKLE